MSNATVTETTTAPMIFMSYRRDDSGGHVGRLYDALSAKFGSERIFVDIDHIGAGQDFVQVVDDAVARCAVLLVVIGKRWAGTGRIGKRRIDSAGDFVRLEVAGGLRRQGLRIIPVLVGGAAMPGPAELPDDIKELTRRNAFELSDTRWRDDVTRLVTQLDLALGPSATPRTSLPSIPKITLPTTLTLPAGFPRTLPPWAKPVGVSAAVLVLVLAARALFGHAAPSSGPPTVGVAAPVQLAIAPDPPKALPARLPSAGQSVLSGAQQQWRSDAVLTQITAKLQSGGASPTPYYELDYAFRSPTDGAGLQITTGVPGKPPASKSLPPVGRATMRTLPPDFVDFPAAVKTARDSGGLIGDVKSGIIAANFSGRAGQPTWLLRGSDNDHPVYVDGATGALLNGSYSLSSGSGSSPRRGQNPLQALKGLFHKH
jgi:hypothetical protein